MSAEGLAETPMAIPVREFFLDSTADKSFICLYDELLVDPSADVERCVICYRIPLSPRYLAAQCKNHTVCNDCGDRLKQCPLCRRRTEALYRNLDLRRLNQRAMFHCAFNGYGCDVKCEAGQWTKHIRECPFEFVAWKAHWRAKWIRNEQKCFAYCVDFFSKTYRSIRTHLPFVCQDNKCTPADMTT